MNGNEQYCFDKHERLIIGILIVIAFFCNLLNQLKDDILDDYEKFYEIYSRCPICNSLNENIHHIYSGRTSEIAEIRNYLIVLMKNQKKFNHNIRIGILCCKCYKKYYPDKKIVMGQLY